jgi:hypothetical protein
VNLLRKYIHEAVIAIGQCYPFAHQAAAKWFDQHIDRSKPRKKGVHPDLDNKDKFRVVHGRTTDKFSGESVLHAWVEKGGMVFDAQTSYTKPDGIPREVYYDMFQPESHNEYTATEVMTNCIKKGGPGPWDEESIDILRRRDEES